MAVLTTSLIRAYFQYLTWCVRVCVVVCVWVSVGVLLRTCCVGAHTVVPELHTSAKEISLSLNVCVQALALAFVCRLCFIFDGTLHINVDTFKKKMYIIIVFFYGDKLYFCLFVQWHVVVLYLVVFLFTQKKLHKESKYLHDIYVNECNIHTYYVDLYIKTEVLGYIAYDKKKKGLKCFFIFNNWVMSLKSNLRFVI